MLPDPKASSTVGATAASAPWLQVMGSETPADTKRKFGIDVSWNSSARVFVIFASRKPFLSINVVLYLYSKKEILKGDKDFLQKNHQNWGSTMQPEEGSSFIRRPEAEWADAKFQAAFWGCNENVKILPVEKRDWRIV